MDGRAAFIWLRQQEAQALHHRLGWAAALIPAFGASAAGLLWVVMSVLILALLPHVSSTEAWTSVASCRAPLTILLGVLLLSWSLASCWVVFLWGRSRGCTQMRRCCCCGSKAVQLSFSIWCVHIFLSFRDGRGLLEVCLQSGARYRWQMELFLSW